jgi:hypothetical protein
MLVRIAQYSGGLLAGRPGFKYRHGSVHTGSETHPASYPVDIKGKAAGSEKLTPDLRLEPS